MGEEQTVHIVFANLFCEYHMDRCKHHSRSVTTEDDKEPYLSVPLHKVTYLVLIGSQPCQVVFCRGMA